MGLSSSGCDWLMSVAVADDTLCRLVAWKSSKGLVDGSCGVEPCRECEHRESLERERERERAREDIGTLQHSTLKGTHKTQARLLFPQGGAILFFFLVVDGGVDR